MSLSILSFQTEEGDGTGTVEVLEECPWIWGQSLTMHVPPGRAGTDRVHCNVEHRSSVSCAGCRLRWLVTK